MTELRITHINTHDVAGGAAKVAWRLADAQRRAGCNARILAGWSRSDSPFTAAFDPRPDQITGRLAERRGLLDYQFQGSHRLFAHPLVVDADLLHLHNLHGGYCNPFSSILLSLAKPTLWTLHDMQALTGRCAHAFDCLGWTRDCRNCPRPNTYPAAAPGKESGAVAMLAHKARIARASALYLAVPSRWLAAKVERSILKDLPCRIIPNFCDTNVFAPGAREAARRRFNLPLDALLVGALAHGGTLDNSWKGGAATRQAVAALLTRNPDIRFVNIGAASPSAEPWLITIPHQSDETALAEVLGALDLFLYTPVADNCPLAVIESLACGLPAATFGVGGVPELVRDGVDGRVARPGDVQELVEGAWSLLSDPQARAACGRNARKGAVARFAEPVALAAYKALGQEALAARQRSHRRPFRLDLGALPASAKTTSFLKAAAGLERLGTVQTSGRWPRNFPHLQILAMESLCAHGRACLHAGQPVRALEAFLEAVLRNPFEDLGLAGLGVAARVLGLADAPDLAQLSRRTPYAGRLSALSWARDLAGRNVASTTNEDREPRLGVSLLLAIPAEKVATARRLGRLDACGDESDQVTEILILGHNPNGVVRPIRAAGAVVLDVNRLFAAPPSWPAMANVLLWRARCSRFLLAVGSQVLPTRSTTAVRDDGGFPLDGRRRGVLAVLART
uniref:Glycosyltransferase n=1 Tax=Desulfovibrio sp. U5L TaxID=596152 RepID=I2Q7M7_9BACT